MITPKHRPIRHSIIFLLILILFAHCAKTPDEQPVIVLPHADNGSITLPDNFGALVVADDLGRGRHLTVHDNGDIYLHLQALTDQGKGIIALRDTTGDGRADIVAGYTDVPGTGIELHKGHLYYSDRTHVYRSKLMDGQLLPDENRELIATLVDGIGHMEKPFTFDSVGNMYVNVGSFSNACQQEKRSPRSPGFMPCTELETRAGIWRFKDDQPNQMQEQSMRYATGIRNAVAIKWDFHSNSLYAMQHGRDDLHRFWPEVYTEQQNVQLPSEEFLQIDEGDDFGWPYCYYDHIQEKRLLNPEYGGDGKITEGCEDAKDPILGLPGHWAPNDLLFYNGDMFPEKYKNGAFIAFHGSWNRLGTYQDGFNIVFVPMKDGKPDGHWEVFADGFTGGKRVTNAGKSRFRPCGLAEGPDGSLYVLDSQKGRVWRIMYYPEGVKVALDAIDSDYEDFEEKLDKVDASLLAGKKVYDTYCLPCHQDNGMGVPGMNPPLSQTEWVNGDKERLIKVILNGLDESVEIKGEIYQNAMAPHAFLSDKQIADVLTFVRKSFGNNSSEVTVGEVKEVRSNN